MALQDGFGNYKIEVITQNRDQYPDSILSILHKHRSQVSGANLPFYSRYPNKTFPYDIEYLPDSLETRQYSTPVSPPWLTINGIIFLTHSPTRNIFLPIFFRSYPAWCWEFRARFSFFFTLPSGWHIKRELGDYSFASVLFGPIFLCVPAGVQYVGVILIKVYFPFAFYFIVFFRDGGHFRIVICTST
jgi:hypothetical protein